MAFQQMVQKNNVAIDSIRIALNELSKLFENSDQDKNSTLKWYKKYINFFEKKHSELGKGYVNLTVAKALCNKYYFAEGIPYYLLSIDNFSKSHNYQMLVKTYNGLSLAYHDFGDYAKGIELANLALKTFQEHKNEIDKNLLWYTYNNLGINYDDSKHYKKAIESHLNALPYGINASDSSYSYNNLGNTSKKIRKLEDAKYYFELALNSAKKDTSDVYQLASVYSNFLDIQRIVKNYSKANLLIDSAYFYASKSKSPEKLIDFYYYAYQLKNETNDYKQALSFLNQYTVLKDSLLNIDKAKIIYDYQIKYETEKKEKQIAETKLISKQKSIWLLLLGTIIFLGFILYSNQRIKLKQKQKQWYLENQLEKEQTNLKIQNQRIEISRDLHDSLGSQLIFMNSILDNLKSSDAIDNDVVKNKINTLSDFSENAISELKNTLWAMHSSNICLEDIRLKMLNFVNCATEAKEDIHFHLNFNILQNKQLDTKVAINIFRVFQEIINNAIKYADASSITIDLQQTKSSLLLQITDNGKGFDYELAKEKSYGLTNIENRIVEIKGKIEIKTAPKQGTYYKLEIPI
ncbi:MAG: hypothetical protein H6553_03240 [Chitinophagales bacterium]|nr:hypothetical protein [Chitinophagales bacterium]